MTQVKFCRVETLPETGEVGSLYFVYKGSTPKFYVCTANGFEQYSDLFSRNFSALYADAMANTGDGVVYFTSDTHLIIKDGVIYGTGADLTGYATEQWVEDKEYLTEHLDISGKVNVEEYNNKIEELETTISGLELNEHLTNVLYTDLKTLVDTGALVPGMLYRIVDYVTSTKVSDAYASAGHLFDIIVTADSNTTLNENARAIQHDGDTYFANSNLAVWKLKYKLDNDSTYMWIDDTCKGVIYEMTDEFDNTFPYDFKNILQPRFYLTNTGNDITNNRYFGWNGHNNADSSNYIMCYTFAREDNLNEDLSLNQSVINGNKVVVSNVKLKSLYNVGDNKYINDIVFLHSDADMSREEWRNISIGVDCYNMTIGGHCYNATILNYSHNITLEGNNRDFEILDWCTDGIIGDDCRNFQIASNCTGFIINAGCFSFTIGNECNGFEVGSNNMRFNVANYCREWKSGSNCQIWSIGNNGSNWSCGDGCSFWTCGEQCYQWSVGNNCTGWSVGNSCNGWSVGNNCKYWSTGNSCYGWSTGNDCTQWSTGNACYDWSTKDYCHAWSVGNNCHTWSVGNHCIAWKAGNRVYNWVFGGQGAPKDYFNSITIESYNHNFCLNTVYTTSSSKICRGIHIAEMAFASLTDWTNYGLTEGNGNVNQLFCTTIGKSGDKKLNVS